MKDQSVLFRRVDITLSKDSKPSDVRLIIPVYIDPKNGARFESWNCEPVENQPAVVSEKELL